MAAGPVRKAVKYSGRTYPPTVGTAGDQTVKTTGGLIGTVSAVGSGTLTIKDGATAVWAMAAPSVMRIMIETQTSIVVNAPGTCTVSMGYD